MLWTPPFSVFQNPQLLVNGNIIYSPGFLPEGIAFPFRLCPNWFSGSPPVWLCLLSHKFANMFPNSCKKKCEPSLCKYLCCIREDPPQPFHSVTSFTPDCYCSIIATETSSHKDYYMTECTHVPRHPCYTLINSLQQTV